MSDRAKLVADVKQWLAQERVWDTEVYASPATRQPTARPTAIPSPPAGTDRTAALQSLYKEYKDCVRCPLGPTRIKFVFGVGNPNSEVMFIGEGPGYQEDRKGEPFVGKAGQLLDKMMAAIGLSRQINAYIANIVKCHPMVNPQTPDERGNDRPPTPEEVETCSPILLKQIAVIKPRFIMTLGSPSTKMILRTKDAITGLRGKFFPFPVDEFFPEQLLDNPVPIDAVTREELRKIRVLPTFHPAALLRNPNLKGDSWTDLKLLRDSLKAS
jgi:DNA polymerase